MVHSSDSKAGLALIDDLQIESTNSAEDGVALGLHFYHPARDEVVNFTMEGTRLTVKATGTGSATGISNRYHNDPDDAKISIHYSQSIVEAYGTQSAVGIDLARTTNSGTNTGITFSARESLKVIAESTEDDATGVNLRNATLSAGNLNLRASGATAADGVYATGSSQAATFNGKLNVSAEGTDEETSALRADVSASITATHGGQITSNHLAVYANRGSQISLSSDETTPLNIQGDVKAERWGAAYSKVTLSMGNGSTWVGNAEGNGGATVDVTLKEGSSGTGDAIQSVYNTSSLGKVKVALQGGTWTLAGNQESSVNQIVSDGGTIDISKLSTDTQLTITNLQASSCETVFYTDTLHNGTVATVAKSAGVDG